MGVVSRGHAKPHKRSRRTQPQVIGFRYRRAHLIPQSVPLSQVSSKNHWEWSNRVVNGWAGKHAVVWPGGTDI